MSAEELEEVINLPPLENLQRMLAIEIEPGIISRDDAQILHLFIRLDDPKAFEECLAHLASVMDPNEVYDPDGWGIVHFVARNASDGMLPWKWPLMQMQGLDINSQGGTTPHGDGGDWPLHLAAVEGSASDIELLLAMGAEVNCVDNNGHNALVFANPESAAALIKAGIDLNAKNCFGLTPLFELGQRAHAESEELEVVRLLIQAGADLTEPPLRKPVELSEAASDLVRAARHAKALEEAAPLATSAPRPRI